MSDEHAGFSEDELIIRHVAYAEQKPNPIDWWNFGHNPLWVKSEHHNAAEYADHVLYLDDAECRDGAQPNIWWRARVKSDGCVDLNDYCNVPYDADPGREGSGDADCYIHICDVDRLIERLRALKALALAHFGKDWPR